MGDSNLLYHNNMQKVAKLVTNVSNSLRRVVAKTCFVFDRFTLNMSQFSHNLEMTLKTVHLLIIIFFSILLITNIFNNM